MKARIRSNGSSIAKRATSLFMATLLVLSVFMFTSATTTATVQAEPFIDPALLAWYSFEADELTSGASGNRKILDSSGNGNNATMYWSSGTFETVEDGIDGASLNFNNGARSSNGAYVQLPADILKNTDNYTISMWFKLTSMPSWARLYDFGSVVAGSASTRQAYIMYAPYSWHTQALLESTPNYSQGTAQIPFTGSSTLNEWVHVDITRDSKATNVYMNGALYATGAAGLSPRGYDFLGAYLGRSGFEGDNYFDGQMDDVRIYSRALSADDVLEQYRSYSAIAAIETSGGPYLMTYTLPAGFSGHLADSATPNADAITQAGIFDYSLHYAYSEDGKTWIPLNDNRGILYWLNNSAQSTAYRYLYPRIMRADGTGVYHLYATAYSNANTVVANTFMHWSSTDLINWTQLENVTSVPEIPADPVTIDTTAKPYNSTIGNVISISESQLTALKDAYATPYFDEVNLTTTAGVPAELPNYGTLSLANGRQVNYGHSVTWDGVPDYETPGVYNVTGTVNYNYTNPVNRNGADPQIYFHDGWYYYTSSWMDDSIPVASQSERNQYMNVTLRRARTIAGLVTTQTAAESRELGYPEEKMVFQGPTGNSERGSAHIWAPEIHRVTFDGVSTWIVLFAGSPLSSKWNIQMMVSVCDSDDPWTGNWTTSVLDDGNTSNNFDLDATVLEHNGKNYLIWANTRSGRSSLWIAEMTSPTTINTNTAEQFMLLTPEYTFENRSDRVLEGATILKEDGKIWLSYSVGSTNSNYNMGLAYAIDSPTTDVMSASSWTKLKYPIMHSNRASKQFGPGHAAFEYDYDGAGGAFPILSYHARGNEDYATNHAPAPLYSPTRWARIAPVYFHRDGTPYVGIPPADGEIPAMPIKGTITVLPADQITLSPLNRTFKPAAVGYSTVTPEVFTVNNPTNEVKNVSLSLSNAEIFKLSETNISVPAEGKATFTVTPVIGLDAGTYSASVTALDGDVERTANFTFSVLNKAPDRYADSSFDLTELTPSETSVTTSYITNANNTYALNGNVIQALYNGERLEKVVFEPFTVAPGSSVIVKNSLDLPDTLSGEHTLKCFVWDDEYIPIGSAAIFNKVERVELPDPLLWYDFDQTSGTSVTDRSGNGYDGTLTTVGTGANYTWSGGELTLSNGSSTSNGLYIAAPLGMMDGRDTFTMSMYAMQNTSDSGAYRFTFAVQQDRVSSPQKYFFFNNAGKYKAAITTASNGGEGTGGNIEVGVSNRNVWEHYIIVLTPSRMSMYVNGNLIQSVPTTVTISDLGTSLNVDLGRSCWSGDAYWAGSFGDFRIYDKAFSEAEVRELTNDILVRTDPRLPQSLVDDWASLRLSQPSGSTITGGLGGMPTKGANGSTIIWGATNPVYLSADGFVRRPSEDEGDQTAVLIATLTAPTGEKVTKAFIYTISAISDAGDVAADTAALMIDSDPYVDGLDLNDFEMDAILPSTGAGGNTTIEWTTSDESVMTIDGKNHVTIADGQKTVTLTATISKGSVSQTKSFTLTCKPPVYGYLLAYFIGNSASQQQNFLALSPDGLNFTWLNDNTKIMEITEGEKAARDHFIIKDPNQEMYYMLATDLDSNKSGTGTGWQERFGYPTSFTNTWGNKAIFVWKSEDLINWTLASHTNFSGLDSIYDFTRGWGNSWAPEAIWVEDHDNGDGTTGAFMMFWSSSPQRLSSPSYSGYTDRNRIVCSFTKDFSQGSFSNPQELYFISDAVDDQIIDACIEWDSAIQRWHMYFRRGANNTSHIERVTSVSSAIPANTAGWTNRITNVSGILYNGSGIGFEGPDMNKVIGKQEWRMIVDKFTSPESFRMFKTTDFTNFTEIPSPETNIGMSLSGIGSGGRVRHGAIIRISRERYEALAQRAAAGSWVY